MLRPLTQFTAVLVYFDEVYRAYCVNVTIPAVLYCIFTLLVY